MRKKSGEKAIEPKAEPTPIEPVVEEITAYKGFDKEFKCRGFQFEVGKTYTHEGRIGLCESGFHACLSPLDIQGYYSEADGARYALVTMRGVSSETREDSKRVCREITIVRELTMRELIEAEVEYVAARAREGETATGYSSTAASSGDSSKAASSGNSSTAASSGNSSTAASSGDSSKAACDTNGFACVAGVGGRVRGKEGSALSLGYRDDNGRLRIAVAYVGENEIEPNVWYYCNSKGEFIKVN